LRGRQYPNFEGIIDVFDAYCETQEEFNEWQKQIINYMKDYNEMIKVLEEEKSFNGLKNFFVEVEEVK
jgi:hypothetical protein